jgi:hypothetical protein
MNHRTAAVDLFRSKYGQAPALDSFLLLIGLQTACATQPAEPDVPPVVASNPPPAQASPGVPLDVQQSPQELNQLVAPIALYPDELVAQVLAVPGCGGFA